MAGPVTNSALNITGLRDVEDRATHFAKLHVIHAGITLFIVFDKL